MTSPKHDGRVGPSPRPVARVKLQTDLVSVLKRNLVLVDALLSETVPAFDIQPIIGPRIVLSRQVAHRTCNVCRI